jgi:ubiquinol-cytochrome c reductase iron-sulfur subunit
MYQDNNTRQLLRVAVKVMVGIGLLLFVLMLVSSLSGRDTSKPSIPAMVVNTQDIQIGEARFVLWEGRPVVVYHRSDTDREAIDLAKQKLLDATILPTQKSPWFVAYSNGTDLGCPIKLLAPGGSFQGEEWLGGFIDTCRGSRYDFAGRVFAGQNAARNLGVPPFVLKSSGDIVLGASH